MQRRAMATNLPIVTTALYRIARAPISELLEIQARDIVERVPQLICESSRVPGAGARR